MYLSQPQIVHFDALHQCAGAHFFQNFSEIIFIDYSASNLILVLLHYNAYLWFNICFLIVSHVSVNSVTDA